MVNGICDLGIKSPCYCASLGQILLPPEPLLIEPHRIHLSPFPYHAVTCRFVLGVTALMIYEDAREQC